MQRFRGGLELKAHRLLYHSTLSLSVIKERRGAGGAPELAGELGLGSVRRDWMESVRRDWLGSVRRDGIGVGVCEKRPELAGELGLGSVDYVNFATSHPKLT